MSWKEWLQTRSWTQWMQRLEQLLGGILALVAGAGFLYVLAWGSLPAQVSSWLGQHAASAPGTNASVASLAVPAQDDPALDHRRLAETIGRCHWGDPQSWTQEQRRQLGLLPASAVNEAQRAAQTSTGRDDTFSAFEAAALYNSERVMAERRHYRNDANMRQTRLRQHQIMILLVSAAATFLIGLKTLVLNKELPFQAMVRGSLLPISVFALLMPVIGTALSGVLAFDDDSSVAVRESRALAQLEQLHGRIADDVISDPYLCKLDQVIRDPQPILASTQVRVASAELRACLTDRFARITAWEQRNEQILNDAGQTLAQAGNLAGPSTVVSPAKSAGGADACATAFGYRSPATGDMVAPAGIRQSAAMRDPPPQR